MPDEIGHKLRHEIGHVVFLDIVGYSKLDIREQSAQLQKLKEIVRGTEQFRSAEAAGKLLRLPTGDGGALVFRTSPEAPVECAIEIQRALQQPPGSKEKPQLRLRMGIHSGPVNEVSDLNEQLNMAGAGINFAQRVMDCGDAGHILLSKHVADDVDDYPEWRPHLHDLGECEVKHGVRVHLFNFEGRALQHRLGLRLPRRSGQGVRVAQQGSRARPPRPRRDRGREPVRQHPFRPALAALPAQDRQGAGATGQDPVQGDAAAAMRLHRAKSFVVGEAVCFPGTLTASPTVELLNR